MMPDETGPDRDSSLYRLQLQGRIDEQDINTGSPLQLTVEQIDLATTCLTFRTDQSGLVGLIRHLHGRGLVLLSLYRER
jgi:hypothetical protein